MFSKAFILWAILAREGAFPGASMRRSGVRPCGRGSHPRPRAASGYCPTLLRGSAAVLRLDWDRSMGRKPHGSRAGHRASASQEERSEADQEPRWSAGRRCIFPSHGRCTPLPRTERHPYMRRTALRLPSRLRGRQPAEMDGHDTLQKCDIAATERFLCHRTGNSRPLPP